MVRALREERRTISERQPVTSSAAAADADTVQAGETEARLARETADVQPAPHLGAGQAAPHWQGSDVPATAANTVPLAQEPRQAGVVAGTGPHPGLNPSSTASADTESNPDPNPNPDPTPHAVDNRRVAAACSALRADAPELLETLKRHGIAGRLTLLDDAAAAGRHMMAANAGGSALSQVPHPGEPRASRTVHAHGFPRQASATQRREPAALCC